MSAEEKTIHTHRFFTMNTNCADDALQQLTKQASERDNNLSRYSNPKDFDSDEEADAESPIFDTF